MDGGRRNANAAIDSTWFLGCIAVNLCCVGFRFSSKTRCQGDGRDPEKQAHEDRACVNNILIQREAMWSFELANVELLQDVFVK